jgi:hypothetical protein
VGTAAGGKGASIPRLNETLGTHDQGTRLAGGHRFGTENSREMRCWGRWRDCIIFGTLPLFRGIIGDIPQEGAEGLLRNGHLAEAHLCWQS